MDREADELAERFIAGSLDLESFLKDFTKTKASYYELSLKIPSVTASSVGEK